MESKRDSSFLMLFPAVDHPTFAAPGHHHKSDSLPFMAAAAPTLCKTTKDRDGNSSMLLLLKIKAILYSTATANSLLDIEKMTQ
jgi:hypothetical protein